MAKNELEFLELLLDKGEVRPELLTGDPDMARRIESHPAIQWKALNVKSTKEVTATRPFLITVA
jgi:hypothetical protein